MTDKVYFSDVKKETWREVESMRYVIIPRRWWSIKDWLLARDLQKNIQVYFMKK